MIYAYDLFACIYVWVRACVYVRFHLCFVVGWVSLSRSRIWLGLDWMAIYRICCFLFYILLDVLWARPQCLLWLSLATRSETSYFSLGENHLESLPGFFSYIPFVL